VLRALQAGGQQTEQGRLERLCFQCFGGSVITSLIKSIAQFNQIVLGAADANIMLH
jgi:hypothetical protein